MKKIKTKRIKAKTYTRKVTYFVCDLCGKEIKESNNTGFCGYRPIGKCLRCKREVCEKCTHYETDPCSDYVDRYCKICWELYEKKYEAILDKGQSKWNKLKSKIESDWKKESLSI